MKRMAGSWFLAVVLLLIPVRPAAADPVIQINGDLAPRTREEALQMVEEASAAFFGDPAVAEELASEIQEQVYQLEPDASDAEEEGSGAPVELVVYTLTHNGRSMQFRMEIKGAPDETGYPLYLALHGAGSPRRRIMTWSGISCPNIIGTPCPPGFISPSAASRTPGICISGPIPIRSMTV